MRRALLLLITCFGFAACSVLPSSPDASAGCTIPIVRITGVEVTPLDREMLGNGQVNYFYSNTLREQVVFAVRVEHETLGEEAVDCPSDPLADPMPGRVVNPVEGFGHVVQFDRSIRAFGTTIPAETNLLEVDTLKDDYGLRTRPSPFAIAEVRFDQATYTFPEGDYQSTFAWVTSDDEMLRDRVTVHIAVE